MARQSWVLKQRPDGKCDLVPRDELSAWLEKYQPKKKLHVKRRLTVERGSWVVRDGKLVPKHLAPPRMYRGAGLQVIKDIEPFQNIAVDGKVIGGRRQRRDMIRAHNLIEVGNEPPVNRKQLPEWSTREFANDIKQAYRDHGHDAL